MAAGIRAFVIPEAVVRNPSPRNEKQGLWIPGSSRLGAGMTKDRFPRPG
jgi:hypothetical protein